MRSVKEVAGLLVLLCLTKDTLKTREVCNHTATGCCGSQSPETKRNPWKSRHLADGSGAWILCEATITFAQSIFPTDQQFYLESGCGFQMHFQSWWCLSRTTLRLAGKRSPPSKAEMALSSSFSHSRESRPEKAPSLNVCESKQGNPSLKTILVLPLHIYSHLSSGWFEKGWNLCAVQI